ncbi:DMT family transporter [Peptococcaceae bacterium 1198_IL3148]
MQRTAEMGMILVTILWGASFVTGKLILASTTPLYYTSIRFIGAAIVLGLIFHKRCKKLDKSTLIAGLLIGAAVAVGYIVQTVGLNYTTASKAGFISGLYVVMVPVMVCVIRRSLPRVNELIGVLLATIGLGVLSLNGSFSMGFGDLMIFVSAVMFATSIILISRFAKDCDPILLTIIQIAVTAVTALIFAIMLEPPLLIEVFDTNLILLLLFTIFFGTAVNTAVQNWAQSKISATTTSLILVLEPVFAGVFGFLLLHDPLGLKEVFGSCLIITGMLITLLLTPNTSPPRSAQTAHGNI